MIFNTTSFNYPKNELVYALNHGLDPSKNEGKSNDRALTFTEGTTQKTVIVFNDACKDVLRLGKVVVNGKVIEDIDNAIKPESPEVFFSNLYQAAKKKGMTDKKAEQLAVRVFDLCCQSVYAPFVIDLGLQKENMGKSMREVKLETHITLSDRKVEVRRLHIQKVENAEDAPEERGTLYTGYEVRVKGDSKSFIAGNPDKLKVSAVKTRAHPDLSRVEKKLSRRWL